jgi:hypothetical protein
MSAKSAKDAAHLGAFLSGILVANAEMIGRSESITDVAVAEASQTMLAGHDGLE